MWVCACGNKNEDSWVACGRCFTFQSEQTSSKPQTLYRTKNDNIKRVPKNPFEILRLSPGADNREAVEAARIMMEDASSEEKLTIKQALEEIITNPVRRLEHEVFTYDGAEFDNHRLSDEAKSFLTIFISFLREQDHYQDPWLGRLKYVYESLSKLKRTEELLSTISGNPIDGRARKIWTNILYNKWHDTRLIHNLALLHQEWAEDFEKGHSTEPASTHWKKSMEYWFALCGRQDFWEGLETKKQNPKLGKEFDEFRDTFPKRLLELHKIRFQELMITKALDLARIHFDCIRTAGESVSNQAFISKAVVGRIEIIAKEFTEDITSKYVEEAKQRLQSGQIKEGIRSNYEAAISSIEGFLEVDSKNKEALRFVVEQYAEYGLDLFHIKDNWTLSSILENSKVFAERLVGQITKGQGHLPENQAVEKYFTLRGIELGKQNKFEEAVRCYKTALEYNPDATVNIQNMVIGYSNWGLSLSKEGRFSEAVECFKESLKLDPSNRVIQQNLAITYSNWGLSLAEKEGKYDEAVVCLKESLKFDPSNKMTQENLKFAENLNKTYGDRGISLATHQCYLELWSKAMEALNDKNDFDTAIYNLKQIPLDYTVPGVNQTVKQALSTTYNNKGVSYHNRGMFREAIKCYEESLSIDPYNQNTQTNLDNARQMVESPSWGGVKTSYDYTRTSSKAPDVVEVPKWVFILKELTLFGVRYGFPPIAIGLTWLMERYFAWTFSIGKENYISAGLAFVTIVVFALSLQLWTDRVWIGKFLFIVVMVVLLLMGAYKFIA